MAQTKKQKNNSANENLLFDKLPPQNLEAEIGVLGAMLLDQDSIGEVIEISGGDEEIFYKDNHKKIFNAVLELYNESKPVDIITLSEYLNQKGELESVGGAPYISDLTRQISTAANIRSHTKIILEKSVLRRLISASTIIAKEGYEAKESADTLLETAEKLIFEISEKRTTKTFEHINKNIHSVIDLIESFSGKNDFTGVPTGFGQLDKMLSGFQDSDFVILAARPSMGKTAFALNLALNAAKHEIPVGFMSLEMGTTQLLMRLLSMESKINQNNIRSGKLQSNDWTKLMEKSSYLSKLPIYIDDTAGPNILEVKSKARQLKMRHKMQILFIDYLQLINGPKTENRQNEISAISRSLKGIAKELNVPVIALSQLSRAVESRNDKTPMLSDLRESGAIEQDADVVMFLHRPEYYTRQSGSEPDVSEEGLARIIVGKQRNGPVGDVELHFQPEFGKFENREHFRNDLENPIRKIAAQGEMGSRKRNVENGDPGF